MVPPLVQLANIPLAEGIAASVQPATSPTAGAEPNKGTEYFMSSLSFNFASDNRIAVWALTNTASFNSASPHVKLQHVLLKTKVYEEPFAAQQRVGPTPLGTLVGDPEEPLSPDDNRMQQVVFSGNLLCSAITSTIFDGSEFVNGILYFIVQPDFTSTGKLTAGLKIDDYLTVAGQNLIYPAIGISDDNQDAMVFTPPSLGRPSSRALRSCGLTKTVPKVRFTLPPRARLPTTDSHHCRHCVYFWASAEARFP